MEGVNFVLIAAIFIIILVLNSFVRNYLKQNKKDLKDIKKSLGDIEYKLGNIESNRFIDKEQEIALEEVKESYSKIKPEQESTYLESILETYEEPEKVIVEEKIIKPAEPLKTEITKQKLNPIKNFKTHKSFLQKYPDIEKFIGENLINKIGIVILVLGLVFLVKYAIDKNWINEIARIAVGVISGGGLIALAHKIRKEYKSFSSVLVGGGLAVLYFTVSIAFHTEGYPLYQQQVLSFIILVFITIFAVFLSIAYDKMEIAILAILGGFGTPLMVSNGAGNYIILFSYLMILNKGMLVLSYYKKWRAVNIVAFTFTVILFTSWLTGEIVQERYSNFPGAIFFATGFYIIFFLMNILYNIKHNKEFKFGDISLIISNTFAYFAFVIIMLAYINDGAYRGLFAVLLAVFNFVFAYLIHKRQEADTNLLYLLVGIVLTFITLAIPLQLEGNYITLFWAAESVLLLWLGQKSGIKLLKLGSVIIMILMLISLSIDYWNYYYIKGYGFDEYVKMTMILNKIFITSIVSLGSLIGTIILIRNEKGNIAWFIPNHTYKFIVFGLLMVVIYLAGIFEVAYQASYYFSEYSSKLVVAFAYKAAYIILLLAIAYKLNNKVYSIISSIISAIIITIFFVSLSTTFVHSRTDYIDGFEHSTIPIIFRWIAISAIYVANVLLLIVVRRFNNSWLNKISLATFIFTILYLLSADLDTIAVLVSGNEDILIHTHKTGYAILWGISSFILMVIGMRKKIKIVRLLSLALFAITLIKLFVYDISNISEGGKIIAFILLGVLLLVISFMYQKLRKLVNEDD